MLAAVISLAGSLGVRDKGTRKFNREDTANDIILISLKRKRIFVRSFALRFFSSSLCGPFLDHDDG